MILVGLGLAIFGFFEKIIFLFRKDFVFLFSIGLFFPEMTTLMSVTGRIYGVLHGLCWCFLDYHFWE